MEEIHNTYCHFDWYTNFILAFVESGSNAASMAGVAIVNAVAWRYSRQGRDYWCTIYIDLEKQNFVFTAKQARIFNSEARNFYTPIYEELKLTNPELFI